MQLLSPSTSRSTALPPGWAACKRSNRIGRAQRDVSRIASHDLDDGDSAVAFGSGANSLDPRCRCDVDCCRIPRSGVVDDLFELDVGASGELAIDEFARLRSRLAKPFGGF